MKFLFLLACAVCLYSCWKTNNNVNNSGTSPITPYIRTKVWGSRPVYSAESSAKQIIYQHQRQPLIAAGNIYAFGKLIFQVDVGRGIHVINNTDPATADRVGFLVVNGCSQICIKGTHLYTNSMADLVTLDISDKNNVREVSRVANAFPEFRYNYPLVQPDEKGYYQCPRYDSVVTGWVRDSIYNNGCYKN